MKIAALMMVRNEAAIIADSLGHLLHAVGADSVHVADNGSTDGTLAILQRIAAADARVRLHRAPGAFLQPEVMGGLLREAVAEGADWLLPNDADEFLWMDGGTLRARCAAAPGIGGFYLRVRNFVQFRSVVQDRPGSIETMAFSATPAGTQAEAEGLVSREGLPFVRMTYPPKLLLRASPSLVLHRGQHGADGLCCDVSETPVGEFLHAPIRSRDDLLTRVSHGERVQEVAPDPGTSWHLKRLVGMDPAMLDAEWRANSMPPGWPLRRGFRLDLRLCRLGRGLREFRARALAGAARIEAAQVAVPVRIAGTAD